MAEITSANVVGYQTKGINAESETMPDVYNMLSVPFAGVDGGNIPVSALQFTNVVKGDGPQECDFIQIWNGEGGFNAYYCYMDDGEWYNCDTDEPMADDYADGIPAGTAMWYGSWVAERDYALIGIVRGPGARVRVAEHIVNISRIVACAVQRKRDISRAFNRTRNRKRRHPLARVRDPCEIPHSRARGNAFGIIVFHQFIGFTIVPNSVFGVAIVAIEASFSIPNLNKVALGRSFTTNDIRELKSGNGCIVTIYPRERNRKHIVHIGRIIRCAIQASRLVADDVSGGDLCHHCRAVGVCVISGDFGILVAMNVLALLFAASLLVDVSSSNVTARVQSADVEKAACRFVGYPAGAKSDRFVGNTNFWAKGIDLSCASPWNSGNASLRAGTLISKRHVIFAQHFPLWKGVRIVFVGQDGGVCPLYIEGVASVPNTDIGVGLLNAEVTPNIMPARVLPDDYAKWIGTGEGLPVLTLDQKECASLTQLNGVPTNGPARVWNRTPKSESWKRFFKRMVGGDSGNPAFALVADQPILLYCLKTGGPGSGTWIHRHKPAIQKAMDELCPGYKLEEFDFGGMNGDRPCRDSLLLLRQ